MPIAGDLRGPRHQRALVCARCLRTREFQQVKLRAVQSREDTHVKLLFSCCCVMLLVIRACYPEPMVALNGPPFDPIQRTDCRR